MAALLAFGASAYLWLYAPDNLRRALSPAIRRLTIGASLVAFVSACVWLSLEAASMADDWNAATDADMVAAVLTDTSFGNAWILRLALSAAFVLVAAFAPRGSWATITFLSALVLGSLALVGHAAMQTGAEGVLHRANHALHLLATGAWLGGLIPFLLCLREYADPELRRESVAAMMRFSFFGHFVVAAIVATGIVNIALTSGHAPLPPTTPYRALLNAKIVVVAAMIGFAVFNRYRLAPRLQEKGLCPGRAAPDERDRGRSRNRRRRPRQRFRASRSGVSAQGGLLKKRTS